MRILLINGNTTPFVTETAAAEARRVAAPGTEIVAVTGTTGARIITTRFENAIAQREMVALAARHVDGMDAVLIAVSYDTALPALRELLPIPVVGMTEAALATAHLIGGRIGLVTMTRRAQPVYRELVEGYGLAGRVCGWRTIDDTRAYAPGDTSAVDALLVEACNDLVERELAEVIVLLGAVMAGAPLRLQDGVPVPLLDGIACGVAQAEVLVRLNRPKPQVGSYALPGFRHLDGVEPEITELLRRQAES
jgi:allantoin racemase